MSLPTVLIAAICAPPAPLPAQPSPPDPRGYVCYRVPSPIVVDGRLDDPAWRDAPWTETFLDIEGDRQPRPPLLLDTRVKMLWDEAYFYIGAELREPHVWATLTQHDAVIFHDNDFEVFIDPNGDSHEYYEFELNALGTTWDLLLPRPYKDGGKAVNNWEIPGLKSAVFVDGTLNDARDLDRGWFVELAFPWRVLTELARRPAPPRDGDQWRVNFSRVEWPLDIARGGSPGAAGRGYTKPAGATEHNWVWSPQGVVDMHRPEMWGYVQFSTGRPGSVAFVPDSSAAARRWLHQVYYAQRDYRQAHGRWAASFDELRVRVPAEKDLTAATLNVAGAVFEVSVEWHPAGAGRPFGGAQGRPEPVEGRTPQRWHIRQDALVWND